LFLKIAISFFWIFLLMSSSRSTLEQAHSLKAAQLSLEARQQQGRQNRTGPTKFMSRCSTLESRWPESWDANNSWTTVGCWLGHKVLLQTRYCICYTITKTGTCEPPLYSLSSPNTLNLVHISLKPGLFSLSNSLSLC
jgi:hypothetical protein